MKKLIAVLLCILFPETRGVTVASYRLPEFISRERWQQNNS